jgi:hypothetical protein
MDLGSTQGPGLPAALADSPQLRDNVSAQGVTGQLDHLRSGGCATPDSLSGIGIQGHRPWCYFASAPGMNPRVVMIITGEDAGVRDGG